MAVNQSQIGEHMPVVCSEGQQVGLVDHMDGDSIKLTKQSSPDGQHHWLPLAWVDHVDSHVHLNRPGDQVRREWQSSGPASSGMMAGAGGQAAPGSPPAM